jgi:iron complex outermembrane receptor protein
MQPRIGLAVITAGVSVSLVTLSADAQETTPGAAAAPIQEIVVTGSRIRRLDTETSSPIQIVDREDIERTGRQSIAEVLRNVVSADNQGSIPTAFSAGFASGASGVSLRGLGVNSTLVLLNGRRLASYGLADDGVRSFVDLNSIPLAAIEKIDVVKDGGSAIYGSDAIAGVVNLILRDTYEGLAIGGTAGMNDAGDGESERLYAIVGGGNERYNAYVALEGTKDRAIKGSEAESFLRTNDLRSRGFFDNRRGAPAAGFGAFGDGAPAFSGTTEFGTIPLPGGTVSQRINLLPCPEISPVTGVCVSEFIDFTEIQPEVERVNVVSRGTVNYTDDLKGFVELGYFTSKVESTGTPSDVRDGGVFNPANPASPVVHTSVLPANHPDNPTGVDSNLRLATVALGGRNTTTESDVFRGIIGIDGILGGEGNWNWNAAVGYIRSELDEGRTGYIRFSALQDALNNGTFRIDRTLNSPDVLASISPTLVRTATNSISLADATVSGSLFELPGGDLGIAIGTEYRRERTDTPPVPFTDTAEIVGLGFSGFSADRDVYSGYFEVNAPVLSSLEINAAYRYDEYNDFGSARTPKIGVKYRPLSQVLLRATYQEGFRAPGPAESGVSASFGFTNIGILTTGNPDVKPEKAKSYSAGFVVEPFAGTNISVDYYKIKRDNEIVGADQAVVVGDLPTRAAPNSSMPGLVPNSMLFFDDNGDLATISAPFVNANKTETDGLDIDIRQRIELGSFGTLTAGLIFSHLFSFERELPDGTKFEYNGTHGPFVLSSAGGTPTDRARLQLVWDLAPVSVTAGFNYVSSLDAIDHKGETLVDNGDGTFRTSTGEGSYFGVNPNGKVCGIYNPDGSVRNNCEIASFTTMDLFATYAFSPNLEFNASITNVFDRLPPFDPYTYGGVNYNPAFHQAGAVGRFVLLGARYTF